MWFSGRFLLYEGDSACDDRSWRNGALRLGAKGEKDGRWPCEFQIDELSAQAKASPR